MCLYPRLLPNPRYKPNQKNGGLIPPINDDRVLLVPVTCGNCIECRKKKAREWQVRLLEETKTPQNAYFITLTFSDQSIAQLSQTTKNKGYALDNHIATIATRRFLERWRKTHKVSLKHWLITELGHNGTNNIHLHGILWFKNKNDIFKLDDHWQYGTTWKGKPIYERQKIIGYHNYVTAQTINYIVKYVTKVDEKYKHYKPVILTSPGIGRQYTDNQQGAVKNNQFQGDNTRDTYKTTTGHKIALPLYYRNKIYTDDQKEQLWITKLNEETRYVTGQKISTANGLEEYKQALDNARDKNQRLGYGTHEIDYDQKEYEQQIRKIMQKTRIQKGNKNK